MLIFLVVILSSMRVIYARIQFITTAYLYDYHSC